MRNPLTRLLRRARLALQEIEPYMALVMMPGGSAMALTAWVYRHWPRVRART